MHEKGVSRLHAGFETCLAPSGHLKVLDATHISHYDCGHHFEIGGGGAMLQF